MSVLRIPQRIRHRICFLGGLGGLTFAVAWWIIPACVPLPVKLGAPLPMGLRFTDRNGEPLRQLLAEDLRVDQAVKMDELSPTLIQATLAAEDQRFWSHGGIDFLAVARSSRDALFSGKIRSGASTISQQLIKISSPPRRRDLSAKVAEALGARHLEMLWDKSQILVAYLNRLPYGNLHTGIRTAARGYFDKPLGDLSLAEAALLAGLPNNPTRLNPYRNPTGAKARQEVVLRRMMESGFISHQDYELARGESLQYAPRGTSTAFHAPHVIDLLLTGKTKDPNPLPTKTVRTTIDLELQGQVEHFLENLLASVETKKMPGSMGAAQGAVVVLDNATGGVLALAGSRSYFESQSGQINGAWTPRSAGSTLKPFTYLMALERGKTAATILDDLPVEYITASGSYRPVNYNRQCHGPVTLRKALANSLNIPAVRMLDTLGGPGILRDSLEKLGLTSLDPDASKYGLGLTLGNAEVRLLELTNAYACLARMGEFRPWSLNADEPSAPAERLFSLESSYLIADILSDDDARADAFGYHSSLRLPFRAAAKTGTSTDYRDNWTVGFTPTFTVGVWVGHFDNSPLQNVSGVSGAGPIFHAVMSHLHHQTPPTWYDRPVTLVQAKVDGINGLQPPPLGPMPRRLREEWFLPGTIPSEASPDGYDAQGRTLLPPHYCQWMLTQGTSLREEAAVRSIPLGAEIGLRIVSPLPGVTAYLDADLPGDGRRFPLQAEGSGKDPLEWSCDSLQIEQDGTTATLLLQPGEHRIRATDPRTGRVAVSFLRVENL